MPLTIVPDEMAAEILCGRLRTSGIECSYQRTDISAAAAAYGGAFAIAGPIEILVDERDLKDARQLLPPED
jgi:Putative prokaryotic signal transducing protein